MSISTPPAVLDPSQQTVTEVAEGAVPRKRTLQVGGALVTAIFVMYFAGLFGIYAATRNAHNATQEGLDRPVPWIPSTADVELTAPTIIWWTSLLMSLVTMQWAIYSLKRNDRRHGLMAIGITFIFGLAVVNQVSFQWNQLGIVIDDISGSAAPPLIYAITISHVIMIIIGMCMLAAVGFRTLASSRTDAHVDSANAAAVFWYAMVAIYFVIWLLIFITK